MCVGGGDVEVKGTYFLVRAVSILTRDWTSSLIPRYTSRSNLRERERERERERVCVCERERKRERQREREHITARVHTHTLSPARSQQC